MKIISSEYIALMLSMNHLVVYLNQILNQIQFRTLMVYYENRTSHLASTLILMLDKAHSIDYGYVIFNVDHNHPEPVDAELGSEFLTICLFDNIADVKYMQLNERVYFDPRFRHIFVSNQGATTDEQIVTFFQNIWKRSVLNVGLLLWREHLRIYTHFPYEGKFAVKVFERALDDERQELPAGLSSLLFDHKADTLYDTNVEVFTGADAPRIYRTPARFRIGQQYHFGGRDGLLAYAVEQTLGGCWRYQTVMKRFGIVDFNYYLGGTFEDKTDTWGRPVVPNSYERNNSRVVLRNLTMNFDLA